MLDSSISENLDRCLDELERLARTDLSRSRLIAESLARIDFLLSPLGSAFVMPANAAPWIVISKTPSMHTAELQNWVMNRICIIPPTNLKVEQIQPTQFRLLMLLDPNDLSKGGLVVDLPEVPTTALKALVSAIAEIILVSSWRQIDHFLRHPWERFQRAMHDLATVSSLQAAAVLLVNELRVATDSDRVSLIGSIGRGRKRVLATSTVSEFEGKSAAIDAIEQWAGACLSSGQSKTQSALDASESNSSHASPVPRKPSDLLLHALALPLNENATVKDEQSKDSTLSNPSNAWCVVLEWNSLDRFHAELPKVNALSASVANAWLERVRWSKVPWFWRRLVTRPGEQRNGFGRAGSWAMGIFVAICGGYLANLPTELVIEARGVLQPSLQRMVFATNDGYVDRLWVEDGQTVTMGQPIALLRSPQLDNRREELSGELMTLAEKRSGLLVAENQIQASDPSAAVSQGRIAAEVREIDAHQRSLRELDELLKSEHEKLELLSPIDGIVVANQIQRNLLSRPVRRGDALLKIVAVDGPWRIEARLSDQDSAYVRKYFDQFSVNQDQAAGGVKFLLVARPELRFRGSLQWISKSTHNDGNGAFVDVHIAVEQFVVGHGQIGSTVVTHISCGQQPWWFVQLRPLIEAMQRRFWI